MEALVAETGKLRRQLTIAVSANEVTARRDQLVARYSTRINLKGFRPGKTPKTVVMQRFGKEIQQEGTEALLREAFEKGIKDHKLRPVGPIAVDEQADLSGNAALKQVLSFDIAPEITLPPLADIAVSMETISLSDDDLDEEINGLRRRMGT